MTPSKTTLVGIAQAANGVVLIIPIIEARLAGHYDEDKIALCIVIFLVFNALLQGLKGYYAKDADRGSDRPQDITDRKLDNVRPFDSPPPPVNPPGPPDPPRPPRDRPFA